MDPILGSGNFLVDAEDKEQDEERYKRIERRKRKDFDKEEE